MNRPRIVVIVVNYRSAALAVEAVRALAADFADPEFDVSAVVVENASGEAAALEAGLAGLERVTLVVSPRNGGFGAGNNIGFERGYADGNPPEFFHLLNPDTHVEPGAVCTLARFMQSHPRAGIAGSSLQLGDGTDWSRAFRFPSFPGEIDDALRFGIASKLLKQWATSRPMGTEPERVDWVAGASMMIRRELLDEVGGFDEKYFLYFEETDFCRKAARAGWECWYVPASRVRHLAGQSTGISTEIKNPGRLPAYWFESRRRYFEKNHGRLYASAMDVTFTAARMIGRLKAAALGRPTREPPHFLRDIWTHGPLSSFAPVDPNELGFAPRANHPDRR